MAGEDGQGRPRDVTVDELQEEYNLEGNDPEALAGEDVDSEGDLEPAGGRMEDGGPPSADEEGIQSAIDDRRMFEDLDDNLEILERRRQREAEEAEEEEQEDADDLVAEDEDLEEEGDEEVEEEEDEEVEAEAEEDEAEEDEEEEDEAEATAWGEWLDENVESTEDRQEIFDELIQDENLVVRYRGDGRVIEEPISETVEKAAGYLGQGRVTQMASQLGETRKQLEEKEASIEEREEQVSAIQEALQSRIDDPQEFSSFLAQRASVEYLENLRDNIDQVVQQAQQNPMAFNLQQRMGRIENMLTENLNGGAAASEEPDPSGRPGEEGDVPEGGIPEDLGFQSGVGYTPPFHQVAFREVKGILRGAGETSVGLGDVIDQWEQEGKKRQIHDVAEDLLHQERRDSRKREIAVDPPNRGRKPKSKVGGGKKKKKKRSEGSDSGSPPAWEDIPNKVAEDLERVQG